MSDKDFLKGIEVETLKTLEKRWYELKGKQMQHPISSDEKNEIRRIERRIAKMRKQGA